ncbi:unnamed protein product [Lactuca saligna]|uniref:Zinc finger, GRF-type n=1 Tax=Lactuca saligna TaxID=75948 RepID=A0AA36E650_LACSI|nr:unnamed protein product [Lactuca saligna]
MDDMPTMYIDSREQLLTTTLIYMMNGDIFRKGSDTRRRREMAPWEEDEVELALVKTSWTPLNPGRRFYDFPTKDFVCGFIRWVDPPMCARSKTIIPGLLRNINTLEERCNRLVRSINMLQEQCKGLLSGNNMLEARCDALKDEGPGVVSLILAFATSNTDMFP